MARHDRTLTATAAGIAGVLVALFVPTGIASAHIDPDPPEAPAGSRLPVGFTVQHGCGESPTVQLDMRLPDGVSDAVPRPPDDWSGEVTETDTGETVVTFAGGPLPADVEGTFTVEMTLPPTPDVTVYFPFVQRCVDGEIRWIDIPEDGSGDELDEPAPAMRLTGPLATTTAPSTTTTTLPGTTSTTAPSTTTADTDPPATEEPDTTTSPPTEAPTTTDDPGTTGEPPPSDPSATGEALADEGDDDGGSDTILVAAIVAAVVAVIGGGTAWLARRNRA